MDDRTFDEIISRALRVPDGEITAASVSRKMQEKREAFWLALREKMERFLLPDCRRVANNPKARGQITLFDRSHEVPASVKLRAREVTFEFRGNFEAGRVEICRTNRHTEPCGEIAAALEIEEFTQDEMREWLGAFANEAFRV